MCTGKDGKLRIGYNGDEGEAKQIKDFYSISYHDFAAVHPVSADGTYAAEAPYDNNVLNSNVAKDGFAKVFGTSRTWRIWKMAPIIIGWEKWDRYLPIISRL